MRWDDILKWRGLIPYLAEKSRERRGTESHRSGPIVRDVHPTVPAPPAADVAIDTDGAPAVDVGTLGDVSAGLLEFCVEEIANEPFRCSIFLDGLPSGDSQELPPHRRTETRLPLPRRRTIHDCSPEKSMVSGAMERPIPEYGDGCLGMTG